MRSNPVRVLLLSSIVLTFSLLTSNDVFSQAALPNVDAFNPSHQTLDQRSIAVTFNANLVFPGAMNTAHWIVTINGVSTGITINSVFQNNASLVTINFSASATTPGHTALTPYLLPGETLRIQYTGNSLITASNGLPVVPFGPVQSRNRYSPGATGSVDIRPVSEGPLIGTDQCSPVNTNFYRWTYAYSLRFVNSVFWTAADQRINVAWNGPPGTTSVVAGYRSDNGGASNPTFTDGVLVPALGPVALMTFCAGLNPTTQLRDGTNGQFSYNDNTNICNFRATGFPSGLTAGAVYNGNGIPALQISHQFDSYDFDDGNTGTLNLNPVVPPASATTTSELVCLGTNVGARFTDASTFNCIGNGTVLPVPAQGAVNNPINNGQRWIRFIYGSIDSPTPQSNIRDARVNGVQVIDNNAGAPGPGVGKLVNGPVGQAPLSANPLLISTLSPTTRGFVVTGAGGPGIPNVPDANGVIELPSAPPAVASNTLSSLITTLSTTNHVVGQRFYVTIQYWNVCNPYPASAPVETTVDFVEIITKPVALTTTGQAICFTTPNSTTFNFTAVSSIGGSRTGVNWYKDRASVGTATKMVNPNGTNSLQFPAGSYGGQGGIGGNFTSNNANGRYHSVWATQVSGATNACESDPVEIVIVQLPRIDIAPDIPSAPSGSTIVCNGGVAEAYSTSAPNTKTIPINTSTNLTGAINLPTENFWSLNNFSVATVSLSATTGNSVNVTYAISPEPNPSDNGEVRVRRRYVTTTNIPVVSPLPAPYTLPTYNINPLACQNANVNLSVDVFGQSNGGTITPSPTICNGSSTGNMTVAATIGAIIQWERQLGAGAFVAIAGTAGLTTFSEVPPSAGTFHYRVLVQNQNAGGPCASATTIVANQNTVTVNPVPAKPTITPSGATTFCFGGSVTLTSSTVNAARYDWYRGATLVQSNASNTIVLNAVAQSGSYTVQTFGIAPSNCPSIVSDPTPVTINPLPSASNPTGGGPVCSGTPAADIVWTLTGNAPFTGTWTDGSLSYTFAEPGTVLTATSFTVTNPKTLTAGTYQLQTLTDVNGCAATVLGGTAVITVSASAPPALQSSSASAAVCDAGGATNPPDATLDFTPNSLQNYDIIYNLNGGAPIVTNQSTDAAGVMVISPTYANMGNTPGSYVLTITSIINTATGCSGIVPIVGPTLVVNPLPVLVTPQTKTICSGAAVNYEILLSPANTPAGSRFSWPLPTMSVGGAQGSTGTNIPMGVAGTLHIVDVLTNTTGAPITATYNITPSTTAGCTGTLRTVVVTINPEPVIVIGQTKTICSGSAVNKEILLNPLNLPTGTRFNWPLPVMSDGSIQGSVGTNVLMGVAGTNHIVDVLTNTSGAPITATYTITPSTTPAGCSGTARTVVITVDPAPVIVSGQTKTICSGAAVNKEILLNPLNLPAGTVFNWPLPTMSAGAAQGTVGVNVPMGAAGTNHIVDVLTNTTGVPITATYTITPRAPVAGCLGTARTVVITINPEPVITPGQTKSICSGQAVNKEILLSPANLPAGTVFNWGMPAMSAGVAQGTPGVNVPMGAAGTSHIVDVLTNSTAAPITATYTITPSSTITGCAGTPRTVVITINPLPVANPIVGPGTVCVDPTNIILYQVTPIVGSTYTWTIPPQFTVFGGGGTNSGNFFVLLSFPTVNAGLPITVVETNSFGCVGPVNSRTIIVAPAPGLLSIDGSALVCKNQTGVNYSVPPLIYDPTSTYNWSALGATIVSASSGVGLQTITVDFGLLASADITLNEVSVSGCSGTPVTLTVSAADRPTMTSASTNTICSGSTPSLVFTSSVLVPSTFNWTVINVTGSISGTAVGNAGSGNISQTLTNISGFSGTVTYRVTPIGIAAPNCSGTPQDVIVTVNPEPVLVTPQNKTVCSGIAANYEILLNPVTFPAGTSFTWPVPVMSDLSVQGSSSGGSVAGGPSGTIHINDAFTNTSNAPITATYTITPTSGSGCLGTPRTVVITINPQPVVSATLNATRCSDAATGLTLAVSGTSIAATSYNVTARTIAVGLAAAGSNAFVPANTVTAAYLTNDAFTNTTNGPLNVTYTVVGVSASGCVGASRIITITIDPEPVVSATLDASRCSDLPIALTLATNGSSVAAANYNITTITISPGLSAGGGNAVIPTSGVAANFLAADTYTNTGASPLTVAYTVVPVSAAGCLGNARVITITINPEPVISATLNTSACSDVASGLTLSTNGASVAAANYNITARTISGGLTAAGTNVVVPASGVTSAYLSGDKFTNNGAAPLTVTYTVEGVSASGCIGNTQVITITINPEPVVSTLLNTTVCSDALTGLMLTTNGTSVGAATYNITARTIQAGLTPGGSNALVTATGVAANYLANDAFTNTGSTSLTVAYTVVPVSAAGCVGDPRVITITIDPEPVIASTLDATVCSDAPLTLNLNTNGSSIGATSYNVTARSIAAGLTAGGANAVVPALGVATNYLASDTYTNTGALPLTVTYTIAGVSAAGCVGDTRVITLIINPEPVVSTTLNAAACSDASISLVLNTNGTSVAALNYNITARTIAPGLVAAVANAVVPATGVATNYLASDKFTNTGATPLTVTYTVAALSAANCLGNTQVITITINPEPVVSNSLNMTQCSNIATGLILNTNGTSEPASTYNITGITISAGVVASGGNVPVPATGVAANYLSNHVFTNSTNLSLTVLYTVVPVSAAGCLGDPKVITVTIDAGPVVSTTLDATVCSDSPIGLTLTTDATSAPAANYNITARTIAGGLVASGANALVPNSGVAANYLAADAFTNTGAVPLTVTYTVIGVGASGCLGNPRVITITINPEPVVATTLNNTICSDASIGLTLTTNGTSVPALDYNITARTIAVGLTPAGANVLVPATGVGTNYLSTDKFTNTGALPLTVTYTVVARSAAGCSGNPQVITMTIDPEPVVSTTLNATLCSDLATGLVLNTNGSSVAAAGYNVTGIAIAAGLSAAVGNAVVPANGVGVNYLANDIFTNTGALPLTVVYTIVPVSASGCLGDSKLVTITIDPEPVVSTTLDAGVCSDNAIALTLNTNGSSVAAANYNITARTIAGSLVAAGANAIVPAFSVASNYLTADSFTNTTGASLLVTYTVVPVSAAGCIGNSRVITITVNPEPVVSTLLNTNVCSDLATGLVLNTNGTSAIAASYNVTARTIGVGLSPAGTNAVVPFSGVAANYLSADKFTNTGALPVTVTYTVVGLSGAGCPGNPQIITVTIDPEPVVANTLNLAQCSDVSIGLTLNTNGTSVGAATYNITARSVAAGLTVGATNAVITASGVAANYLSNDQYTNTGAVPLIVTYTVVPVSAAGCVGDAKVITVTIDPEPVVSTTLNATVCSDLPVSLTLNTNGSSVAAANYNVTAISAAAGLIPAGTNAVVANGVAANYLASDVFTNPTGAALTVTYTVAGVSATGCIGNTRVVTMTIDPEPVVSATLNATICSDLVTGLTLNTNGVSVAAASYNITAMSIAGGLIAAGTNAAVPANGVAANYLAADKFNNIGGLPLLVTYTVQATSAAGCLGDTRVITITIAPEPVVSNSLNLIQCSDIATNLVLNTNGTSVAAATYNVTAITVAAGLTAAVGNAVVPATGVAANYLAGDLFSNTGGVSRTVVYTVVPVSASGCLGDSKLITVTINPEPVVSASLNTALCSDSAIGLTLNTNGTSVAAANYNIAARSISAGLTAAGGNAVVPFSGVASNYLSGDVFTNLTNAALTVTYTVAGVSADGCVGDTRVITITINPEPIVSTLLNATVCSDVVTGLTLNTSGASVAAVNYNVTAISVTAGLIAAGTNAVVPFSGVAVNYLATDRFTNPTALPLTVTYTVVGISAAGCVGDPQVITLTITPEPVVSPLLNLAQCSDVAIGLVLNTDGTSVAAANYNITARNIAAGLTASGSNAVVTANGVAANYLSNDQYTNTGALPLTVTYTVVPISAAGCVGDAKIITITINPEPVVSAALNATVCSDLPTNLILNTNGTSVSAATYNITARTISAGLTAAVGNAVVPGVAVADNYLVNDTFTNPTNGSLTVTYTVVPVSAGGCVGDARVVTITVDPEPVVSPSLDATRCSDAVISLVLATNGSSVAAANYDITARTIDPSLVPAGTNVVVPATGKAANYLSSDRFTNTGAVPLLVTYTVVPVSAAGCKGNAVVITITIDPEPVVANGLNAAVCSDLVSGLTLNTNGTSVAAANYNITGRTVAAGLVANGGNAIVPATGVAANYLGTDSFTNTTSAALTVTYTVVPVSAAGCLGDAKVITITINPEPVIVNGLDASKCSDLAIGLTLSTTGTSATAANYNITSVSIAPGLTALGGNAVVPAVGVAPNYLSADQYTNPGVLPLTVVYTVVPVTAGGCLGDPKTITLTINAEPVGVNDVKSICSDASVAYDLQNNVNTLGNGFATNFAWLAASNGSVTGESTTSQSGPFITDALNNVTNADQVVTYTVTPTGSNGCIGNTFTIVVTVRPEPVGLNDVTTINSDIILNYSLQNNVNTLGNNLPANFAWIASINSNVAGESTTLQAGALITDVLTNVTNSNQVVTYTVTPTGTNGCAGNSFLITITVLPEPVGVNEAITRNSDVTIGYSLQNNVNSSGNGLPSTFVWVAAANPLVTGESTAPQSGGTLNDIINNVTGVDQVVVYTVTPTGTNGVLGNTFTITVTVRSEPLGAPDAKTVCSDVAVGYNLQNNLNTLGNAQASTFTWFAAANPNVTGESTTSQSGSIINELLNNVTNADQVVVYTVTPTGTNSAVGNTFLITVTVRPEPVVATTLDETKCSGEVYAKVLNTNGISIGAATYDVRVVSKEAGITGGRPVGLIGAGGSPANILIADAYVNTTAAPLKVRYGVIPNGTNGCIGDEKFFDFTINPEPVMSVPAPADICSNNINSPSTTNIILATNGTSVNANLYRIDQIQYSNGGPFGVAPPVGFSFPGSNKTVSSSGGINHIKDDIFVNTSLVSVIVRYSITPISLTGCEGDAVQINITVNPEPKLDPALSPTPICSGDRIDPTNTGFELRSQPAVSVAAVSFILRGVAFSGPLTPGPLNESTGAGKLKDDLDDDSYINITTGPLTATYTIAPVSASGCVGADQTVVIIVNPAPAMKSGLDRIVCNGAIANIVLQDNSPTTIGATNYDIISVTVPVGLTADAGNATIGITADVNRIRNDKFVNSTTDRIIVTYQVVPVSVAGCRGPQAAITLTVEPQVSSVTVNTTPDICSGSPVNLTFASPTYSNGNPSNPVVTFSYTMVAATGITGNTLGNNLSEGTIITDILVNSTNNPVTVNYKVTPRASAASNGAGCNGNVEDVFVIVQPRPKINLINNKTVCEGDPVNLSLISTTVPSTGSIKFFVSAVASSGNVTGFTNNLLIANNTVLADALANNGSVTESVTYTIEPRNVDGANTTICAGPPIDVIVTVSPKPIITPIADFSICSGEPFNPIPIVTDTENAIPGSTLVTWTVTPDATVTGESNGAGNSFSQVLFNNSNDKKTVVYTINAKNISNSPSCSGTPITLNVTVYPVPKLVSLPSSINVCNNSTLTPNPFVLNSSVVASLSPVFDWIVDDGTNPDLADLPNVTNGTSITQTFVNGGSFLGTYQYTITPHLTIPAGANPIAGNTCTGQDGIMVVNVAPPVSGEIYGFDITGTKATTLFMCKGANEFIYIDPVGLPLMEVVYKEGSTTKTLTKLGGLNILKVSPAVTTTYELISVKDKFGCVKTINQVVTVNVDAVSNEFSIVGPDISCSPFEVQFKHNQVAGVNYTWKWLDGPDSTTYQATSSVVGKIIKHTFANPSPSTQSKFKVSLEAFLDTTKYLAGCKKLPFVKEIKVYPTISTGVFPDNTVLCSGETVKFVNTSQGVSASGHRWFYRVQGSSQELDVKTTSNVSYTLINASSSNPIIYEVVYKATNGNCPAEPVVTEITVYRGATPAFNEGTIPPYIGGHSIVTFTNTTVPIDATDFRYEWEFGADGNPDAANGVGPFTIDYTTPGEKDVILTVTNIGAEADGRACVSEFRKTINILLLPLVADFKATPQAACFPSDITVTENTATGDLMEWRVVDSNGRVAATSNANLPVFQIPNPGKYSIFLKSSSSFTGQVANTQQDNFEIYPVPVASFDARPTLLFVPDTELNTFNFTTGATDYFWDFGDNGTSDEKEPKYKYKVEGVYDLTLIASNDHGDGVVCSDTLSRKITAKQGGVTKVPNAFTPNPNGSNGGVSSNGSFNDVFLPYVKGAEEFNMQIFDRWGNLIFESNNSTIGWDGYDRNGRLMQSGVYVYKLTLRLSDGQRTTQIGDITMIR